MNKFKLALAGLLAVAFVAMPMHAENANKFAKTPNGVMENLNFIGTKVGFIDSTVTAKSIKNGEGFLDAICPFGGTLGKYTLAFDEPAVTGSIAVGGPFALATQITPQVFTRLLSTSWASAGQYPNANSDGCWRPSAPIKFVNGLYGLQNDAAHYTLFYYHCSDGSNPCL